MSQKQYFVSKETMRQGFAEIIEDDPAASKETAFHDALLEFAGKETNQRHAVFIIVSALSKIVQKKAIKLSRYAEAILDDPETIAAVKTILESVAAIMTKAEMLKIPDFPSNSMGIQRGTLIRSNHIVVEKQLGIKIGEKIPVGFDGEYVRCGPFTWSIDQLMDEIDRGYWVIDGLIDLSNPLVSLGFAEKVEQLDIPDMEKFTKNGQRIVIQTHGYGYSEGYTVQITLPSGKYMYVGAASACENRARKQGLECKTVYFYGACIYSGINDRAHDRFPIQIDGISVADFLDKIATEDECRQFSLGTTD